jgi:hypothetical protein
MKPIQAVWYQQDERGVPAAAVGYSVAIVGFLPRESDRGGLGICMTMDGALRTVPLESLRVADSTAPRAVADAIQETAADRPNR